MHKSTQVPGERLKAFSPPCSETLLDTSEQVPLSARYAEATKQSKENLSKRARAKFITNIVATPLSKLRSPLEKAYKLTERCSGELTEVPGKLTGLYCGCRWCLVCSRIRTARLITGYMPAIEAMAEKWFLTLSRPNVVGAELEDEIAYYLSTARLIQRCLRERLGLNFSSLRKIECTYNEEVNTFHPHFHFIFDSKEAAQAFLDEWLDRNSEKKVGKARAAILNKGNQLIQANDKSVMELFKYFTKVVSKTKSKAKNGTASSDYRIHLAALDTMFVAMRGTRTFQPCGVIKAVSEEIEPEIALESGRDEVNFWKWLKHDWVNIDTERTLTGYVPAPGIQDIESHLVYPAGVPKAAPAVDLTPFYVDKLTGEVVPNENAHLHQVRFNPRFAKVYPILDTDKPKRGSVLRPIVPCAYFIGPDTPKLERAAVPPVPVPAGPVAPQMALFDLPAPGLGRGALRAVSTASRSSKKPARPPGERLAPPGRAPDLATATPNPLFF
jgi:hypothetical protein